MEGRWVSLTGHGGVVVRAAPDPPVGRVALGEQAEQPVPGAEVVAVQDLLAARLLPAAGELGVPAAQVALAWLLERNQRSATALA